MRRHILSVVVIGAAFLTSSCFGLGGSPPVIHRHSIDLIQADEVATEPMYPSLAVRAFESRQRYEARVLRVDADGATTYLEFDRWLEDPQDALTDVVREALSHSGAFDVVAPATSGFSAAYILDGTILRCDVLRPANGPWRAQLSLRLDVARVDRAEMLHAAVYSAERALPGASTDGLGAAMTACAVQVVREALADWEPAASGDR